VRLHEVENPHPQVVKHADLHCMVEVTLGVVAHYTGNLSKHVALYVNVVRREYGIHYMHVGIAGCSI